VYASYEVSSLDAANEFGMSGWAAHFDRERTDRTSFLT
jgi:hypothetical protein